MAFPVGKLLPGEPVSRDQINQLGNRANLSLGITADGDIGTTTAGGQGGISDQRPVSVNDLDAVLRVSTSTTAAGWYTGRVFWRDRVWSLDPKNSFGVPLENTLPEKDDCYIVNLAENSTASRMSTPAYTIGRFVGYTKGTIAWPIFAVNELFPRTVTISTYSALSGTQWVYTGNDTNGNTVSPLYNGFEPCAGTPGPLGINVGSTGQVSTGTCVVKPIGPGAKVLVVPGTGSSYLFSAPNSAS